MKKSLPQIKKTKSESKDIHKQRLRSVITDTKLPSFLEGSLATVNELSRGLSVAMPNQELFKDYSTVLNLQKSAFEQVMALNERFKGSAVQLNNITADILAPVSATIAGIGLATANANQLFNLGKVNESALLSVQKLSDLCLDTIRPQQEFTLSSLKAIEDAESLISRFPDNAVTSLRMITNGLDGVMRSALASSSVLDLPGLEVIRKETSITKEETAEYQRKLDILLREVNPELIEFRLGCWSAFNAKGLDYIGQASSSMRRLVDGVLRNIAPNEKVATTEYFKVSPEAKKDGKPTRRARIYCATGYDIKKAEHLERLATGLLSAYNNLSAWDHRPEKEHDFVYGSFIAIEGYLLSLLSELKREK